MQPHFGAASGEAGGDASKAIDLLEDVKQDFRRPVDCK